MLVDITDVSKLVDFYKIWQLLHLAPLCLSGGIVNGGGGEHVVDMPGDGGDRAQVKTYYYTCVNAHKCTCQYT